MRTRSAAADILARRLQVSTGRVQGLTQRLSDAGLVSKAEGDRSRPPELPFAEIGRMALAVLADRGLGRVVESVNEFGALTDGKGRRLSAALQSILTGAVDLSTVVPGALVLRLNPANATILTSGYQTQHFGPEPPETAGRFVYLPGRVLAAVALEVQGHSPAEADALVARACRQITSIEHSEAA